MQVARLRSHLDQIKRDDRLIKNEGIEALSEEELRSACRARGMRAPFGEGAAVFMRKQLKEWLDLSLNRSVFLSCGLDHVALSGSTGVQLVSVPHLALTGLAGKGGIMVCGMSLECMCRALPSSLLLLSRAFTVTQPLESPSEDAPFDSLKETISSLPNKVWHPLVQPAKLSDSGICRIEAGSCCPI